MRWRAQIRRTLGGAALVLALCGNARSETRPQYGGVLRLEVRTPSVTLNPRRWKAGSADYVTNQRLAELVFERLVSLDNYGRFQPQLATEWSHDGAAKRWQFTLRQGVKFSDGTACEPSDVIAALQPLLPSELQISPAAGGVVIQSANPASDLLEVLASGPYFVFRSDEKGGLVGTGPFVLEGSSALSGAEKNSADGALNAAQRLRFRLTTFAGAGVRL